MTSRNLFGNRVIDVEEDAAIADRLQQEEYRETDDPLSQGQPPFESTDATAQPAIASTDAPVHMPPTTILSRSKKAPPATATTTTMPYALVRRLFRECSTTFAHSTCSAPIRLVRYINLLHGRVHCALLLSSGVRQAATTCTASEPVQEQRAAQVQGQQSSPYGSSARDGSRSPFPRAATRSRVGADAVKLRYRDQR